MYAFLLKTMRVQFLAFSLDFVYDCVHSFTPHILNEHPLYKTPSWG